MHGVLFTPTFQRQAEREGLSETELLEIASSIAADPRGGDLISGTGGARKVRHAGRGHGKSGGYRTIHYFGGEDVPVFLLAIYGKGTQANLTKGEKNQLAAILPKIAAAYKAGTKS
jgi:hypothetical protein